AVRVDQCVSHGICKVKALYIPKSLSVGLEQRVESRFSIDVSAQVSEDQLEQRRAWRNPIFRPRKLANFHQRLHPTRAYHGSSSGNFCTAVRAWAGEIERPTPRRC